MNRRNGEWEKRAASAWHREPRGTRALRHMGAPSIRTDGDGNFEVRISNFEMEGCAPIWRFDIQEMKWLFKEINGLRSKWVRYHFCFNRVGAICVYHLRLIEMTILARIWPECATRSFWRRKLLKTCAP